MTGSRLATGVDLRLWGCVRWCLLFFVGVPRAIGNPPFTRLAEKYSPLLHPAKAKSEGSLLSLVFLGNSLFGHRGFELSQ
jgi:hypothetical protein